MCECKNTGNALRKKWVEPRTKFNAITAAGPGTSQIEDALCFASICGWTLPQNPESRQKSFSCGNRIY